MGMLEVLFGSKMRKKKKCRGRKAKKPSSSKAVSFVMVRGRRRRLYRGCNGGLYYRTKTGRRYVDDKMKKLKKRRPRRAGKKLRRGRKGKKLKQTKAAIAARRAYRLRKARMARRARR